MNYATALFIQAFTQELRVPGRPLRSRVTRTLLTISPTLKRRPLRIYTEALLDTITVDGTLRSDWPARVEEVHGK